MVVYIMIFVNLYVLLNPILEEQTKTRVNKICLKSLKRGKKILFFGNGGSASDAQHIAAELVGKFEKIRIPLPAIALTTDTSIMTAVGNDFDFSQIFERQIEALGQEGDIFFGLTTSGNSKNIINAFISAKDKKIKTIALTSKGENEITKIADYCIRVPSNSTARIQECHILIGHIFCEIIDNYFDTYPKISRNA